MITDAAQPVSRTALILGATGLVGGHCLRALADSPIYSSIIAPTRRPLSFSSIKLINPVIDFDRLDDFPHIFAVNDVFCCLGTTIKQAGSQENFRLVDHDYPIEFGRRAKNCGAGGFALVSATGARRESKIFYNRVKGEVEQAILTMGFRRTVILRPALLLGQREETRLGEKVGAVSLKLLRPLLRGPLARYRPVRARDVGRALVRWLTAVESGVEILESEMIGRSLNGDLD